MHCEDMKTAPSSHACPHELPHPRGERRAASILCLFGLNHGVSLYPQGKYYEAICQDIDPKNKTIVACFPKDTGLEEACFRIPYDILVVGEFSKLALQCLPMVNLMCHWLLKGCQGSSWAIHQASWLQVVDVFCLTAGSLHAAGCCCS